MSHLMQLETSKGAASFAPRFQVRALEPNDFHHLQRLEREIWSADETGMLCGYYLRLCTNHYAEWCFIAFEGERPVGYVLNFPKGREVYCATLAVAPEYQKSRVSYLLIRAMVNKVLAADMEACHFLVEPDNMDAREIHNSLGARVVGELQDYYHPGDLRLHSVITKDDLERLRHRYSRLKLVS